MDERDEAAVSAACQQLISSTAGQLKRLSGTIDSAVYSVQLQHSTLAVVKIRYGSARWRTAKEALFYTVIGQSSLLNTALVLGYGSINDCDATALITSFIKGQRLSDAIGNGLYLPSVGRYIIGALLAKFHYLKIFPPVALNQLPCHKLDDPGSALITLTMKQDEALRNSSFSGLADRLTPCFRRIVELAQLDHDWVWCHGDLHPANVIVRELDHRDETLYIIDFESAIQCVSEYDIAKSIVTSSALDRNHAADIVRGFGVQKIISQDLIYAFVVFHTVDGWLYAAQLEKRDCQLWDERLKYVLAAYVPYF